MKAFKKRDFPVSEIRRYLEPGPAVLVSSAWKGKFNIMTMGLFIWEVVKAHVATSPKYPETFHYRSDGIFMISGRSISLRRKFKPQNL